MKKAIQIICYILTGIILVFTAVFYFAMLNDMGNLINPATVVLPMIVLAIFNVSMIILSIATTHWNKGEPCKKTAITAVTLILVCMILFFISKAINQQILINTFR